MNTSSLHIKSYFLLPTALYSILCFGCRIADGTPVLKEHEAARYNPIYCDQNGCVGNHGNKAAYPPCGLAETDVFP